MSSKVIDQRVVQMEFDNRRFEKNVSTTMSSLDKLKQKLNFNGAAKGFENIDSASKKVNMKGLASAVDTVHHRFSALEVMGVTALANITNSAVNAGKRIISALTIDPVKTGFSEYETQINAVQTILANTSSKGTTLDDVNKALDTLNTYADKTIYNFTEMTRNIGTFTAAGVDLDTSVNAIQGIANLAAVSGSTSQQASTAMYQLSQALASGTVKLMDWNSVVNAGMGGEVFQNALKETARVHGVAIDDIIKKNGSFRDSLHEEWLTTEILTETLEKFTMATEGVSEAEIEANKQKLKSIGYTEKQIEEIFKLGDTATNAATKVKTFSQLWDTLKEAAQSGWTQTWEIIVGDFEEAKSFLTTLSDGIGGFINSMSNWRNNLLEGALGSKWGQLTSKINEAGISTDDFNDKLKKVAKDHGIAIDDLIKEYGSLEGAMASGKISTDLITETLKGFAKEATTSSESTEELNGKLEYFQDVVRKVWRGDYGNMEDRYKALTAAGYDYAQVQALVNKTVDGHELTLEDLTETQLKSIGYTDEQIKSIRALADEAKKSGTPINELINSLDQRSGRQLLIDSLKNAAQGLVKSFTAIKDAWIEIFPPMTSNQLYNIIVNLERFSQSLRMSDETADKLKRTFKGLFALLDIVLTLVAGPVKMAFKAVLDILGLADVDILSLTANIGDAIVKLRDWIDEHNIFTIALKKLLPFLKDAAEGFKNWIDGLKEADNVGKYIVDGLVNGIWNGLKAVGKAALEIGKKLVNTVKDFLGIHSPSTVFFEIGKNIIQGLFNGLKEGASLIWTLGKTIVTKLTEIFSELTLDRVLAIGLGTGLFIGLFKILSILGNFAKAAAGIVENVGDVLDGIGDMFTGIGKMFKGMGRMFTSIAILNIVIAVAILVKAVTQLASLDASAGQLWNAVGIIAVLSVIVAGLSALMALVNKLGGVNLKSTLALAAVSGAIFLLVVALSKLVTIKLENVASTLAVLGTLVGTLVGVVAIMGLLAKSSGVVVKAGGTLLAMSIAMLIMLAVVKMASKMEEADLKKGLKLVVAFGAICAALIVVSKLAGKSAKDAGKMIRKISVSMLLMLAVVKLASMIPEAEVKRGMAVVALIGGLFLAVLLVSRTAGAGTNDAGKAILRMSIAMLAMVAVMKIASGMSKGEIQRGLSVMVAMGALFAAIIAVSKLAGEHAAKAGIMLLAMSGAMLAMVAVLFLLSQMDISGIERSLGVVTVLSLLFGGLIAVTKLANDKILKTLIVLTVAVGLLGGLVIGMSFIDPSRLATASVAMSLLVGVFSALIGVTKFAKNTKQMIRTLSAMLGVVVVLAGVLFALALLPNPATILPAAAALSLLMVSLTASMLILGNSKSIKKGIIKNAAIMAAVLLELAVVLGVMSLMNVQNAIPNAIALSILLPVLSVCLLLLGMVGKASKSALSGVLALAAMAAPLALFGLVLAMMSAMKVQDALPNVVALTALMAAMTLLLIPLTLIGSLAPAALLGVLSLAAMAVPLALVGLVLAMMSAMKVQDAIPNTNALVTLLTAMTLLLIPLTIIGALAPAALLGVLALTAMMVPLALAVLILAMMKSMGVDDATSSVESISKLLTTLTLLLIPLTLVGTMALPAITGIGVLITFLTVLGTFIVAVGALLTWVPKIEEFIDVGVPILEKLAYGIGSIIGSLLGGLSAGIASGLPEIGQHLSDFMSNAKVFIDGSQSLNSDMVAGVKALAEAITTIGQTDCTSIGTIGPQLEQLGRDLGAFSTSLTDVGLDDAKVETVKNAALAIKALADVSSTIPNSGGWAGAIVGDNDISLFAEQFPILGAGLSAFVTNIGSFGEDQLLLVQNAANAVTSLATAASDIPNQGGWVGAIVGENTMDQFAAQFPKLGSGLSQFLSSIGTFESGQLETVKAAADAVVSLATAADKIPNQGGWVAAIIGDNSLSSFASQFPLLGSGLKGFIDAAGDIKSKQIEAIKCAADAVVSLATAASRIPNQGGWAAAIVGDNDLGTFATQFPLLGSGIRGFVDKIGELTSGELVSSARALEVVGLMTDLANVDVNGLHQKVESLGKTMTTFGDNIVTFSNTMDTDNITISLKNAVNGVKDLVNALAIIPADKANHLKTISTSLKELGTTGVKSFVNAYSGTQALNSIKIAATSMVQSFITGVKTEGSKIASTFELAVSSAYARITTIAIYNKFVGAGANLAQGFANGISNNTYKVTTATEVMASAAIRAAKAKLDEHSPSRVFYGIGDFAVQGFANALTAGASDAYGAGSKMADAATNGLSDAISRISAMLESGIDTQPVIRPVLDLDNVRTGASQIGGMLSMSPSVGVLANVHSIASTMNTRGRNGVNDGVISELGKLRKDISSLKHVTYNIDGVTYGEGSDVAEAIETLVRAAIIERRV